MSSAQACQNSSMYILPDGIIKADNKIIINALVLI
jgi:hypothetical protein